MATNLSDNDHREIGAHIFEYIQELLAKDGDKATITLHADHMRSLDRFVISQIECPGS
ncbi:hypothetical protein JQ607_34005 [Bradyrhizobium liaoningense]|uniref:hypothetical protein n=1 Tax=Bradyrhizobium liaoningense TaxID=43992 RepID=UPI001BAA9B15|nr:hypothetical protein [Bradyrhizobium liaoningense]MBR0845229.1 hypothetical protein [Bradyrhizobium liaoningense]